MHEIQTQALKEYDLPALIQENLDSARTAVAAAEVDDQYGLLDYYQGELARIEEIAAAEIPADVEAQIELIRRINKSSGEGIGNVLDVTDVSYTGGMHVVRPYRDEELVDLIGSSRPTLSQSEQMIGLINELLGRGDSVCFQLYSDGRSQAIGWCFVGNTID
ncbi:hypothetical protein GC197_18320 [bacterium]|nr:hypothetical protein [bacterium]